MKSVMSLYKNVHNCTTVTSHNLPENWNLKKEFGPTLNTEVSKHSTSPYIEYYVTRNRVSGTSTLYSLINSFCYDTFRPSVHQNCLLSNALKLLHYLLQSQTTLLWFTSLDEVTCSRYTHLLFCDWSNAVRLFNSRKVIIFLIFISRYTAQQAHRQPVSIEQRTTHT